MEKLKAIFDRPHEEVMKDLQDRRRQQRKRNQVSRVLLVMGASALALGGAVMLVLPGPKLPALALGFYLQAFEFDWAERLVERAMATTEKAKRKYERAGLVKKYGGLVLVIFAMVASPAAIRAVVSAAG